MIMVVKKQKYLIHRIFVVSLLHVPCHRLGLQLIDSERFVSLNEIMLAVSLTNKNETIFQ